MGKGGGGGSGTQTTRLDPNTEAYAEYVRGQAQGGYENLMGSDQPLFAGPNQWQQGAVGNMPQFQMQAGQYGQLAQQMAQGGYGQSMQTGAQGIGGYMNPYMDQVIGAMQPQFARQQAEAANRQDQYATQAGAYGGSRSAIAAEIAAQRQGEQQNLQIGQMLQQGYGQSMGYLQNDRNRGMQMANLGLGNYGRSIGLQGQLAGQQFGMGGDLRDIQNQLYQQELYRQQQGMGMLQGAYGPYGQTTTQTGPGGNPIGGAAGGALMGAAAGSVIPGLGTLAGGIMGGLGGLFGAF